MTVKVCLEPDCPALTRGTRCRDCERAKDKARGTRQERGYGAEHDALRAEWAPIVAQGGALCWRCREPLDPSAWTLGHCDDDRTKYHGPECPPCDYATAGRTACPHPMHSHAA